MPDAPPGRPTRNNSSSQIREQLQVYLLLVLGIGLMGAGTAALGFAAQSVAAVGIGAGAMVAAGLLSVFFGLVGSRLNFTDERAQTDAEAFRQPRQPRDPDPLRTERSTPRPLTIAATLALSRAAQCESRRDR